MTTWYDMYISTYMYVYNIYVSNCISNNLSTPWYHVPSTASSVPSAVAVVGDGSFSDGWVTVSPMWMTLTASPGSRKRPNGTTWFNTAGFHNSQKSLELGAKYINLQCRDCDPDSPLHCFHIMWGLKAPSAPLSLSPPFWAANRHLSCKIQCIQCIQQATICIKRSFCSLHVHICARFTYFLQDMISYKDSALPYLSKTKACKSSVAMSVRVFVQVSWHCYSAIVLGISGYIHTYVYLSYI